MKEQQNTISTLSAPPVSIVLLAHNEAEVIESVVRGFHEKIASKIPGSEIIVAEDGSTDGTKEILARLVAELGTVRWEEGKERLGYVNAYKKAMTLPKNEWIVFCDCSGKHDPDDVWNMLKVSPNFDLVLGYKVDRQDPLYRIVLAKGFNFIVNSYFKVGFRDIDCPLRLFRKSAFLDIASQPWMEKALINFEVTLRFVYRGYRVTQVPVKHFARTNGPSRGLPIQKIPKVIKNTLHLMPALKAKMSEPGFRRT